MSEDYRVVRLLKNHLYPTYQLHAYMASEGTDPQTGLRLAALTTMHWLRKRLGDEIPEEWSSLPDPEEYLSATDEDIPSLYINQGHVINIVSLPSKGMWTLQITEPDLGSDPGNAKQERPPVPGRIIETNIAFRNDGKRLECGFLTMVSDPVGTEPEAEVYRLAVVGQLMRNPVFGLKQVTDIPMDAMRISNTAQVKTMLYVTHHAENSLPAVIFTQPVEERRTLPVYKLGKVSKDTIGAPDLARMSKSGLKAPELKLDLQKFGGPLPPVNAMKTEKVAVDPQYDLKKFCYYTFSHCRTYLLERAADRSFSSLSGVKYSPGDVVVLYPTALGGGEEVIPYRTSASARKETVDTIERGIKAYLKERPIDFGGIVFLSDAREHLLSMSDELLESAESADAGFRRELEQLRSRWKSELTEKDREIEALSQQLQRQKEYAAKLEDDKTILREDFSAERDGLQDVIRAHEETIAFLKRRYDQPVNYDGIEAWVEEHFSGRLYLHPKAVSRMLTKSCQCAAVELICDALDYLATDYWEQRYEQLSKDIALTRCSEKYGRPFEITPIGSITLDFYPTEYSVPYKDRLGRTVDTALDYHLRVGNDSENLLRIYFMHDDAKQLIVIGSLPDHLRTVTIK